MPIQEEFLAKVCIDMQKNNSRWKRSFSETNKTHNERSSAF